MVAPYTKWLLATMLAAASQASGAEGPRVRATSSGPEGFFVQGPHPFSDGVREGLGSVTPDLQDRVNSPAQLPRRAGTPL